MEPVTDNISGGESLPVKWMGEKVETLPTPCIVAEIDKLEKNLDMMDTWFAGKKAALRPHFKSHKCVELARRQIEMPHTTGITCAKTSEAEQLVEGGIRDVLIANQVIGTDKTDRVAAMNRKAQVRVAVDSRTGIEQLARSAEKMQVETGVLIEVNIGMNRGGVEPGEETLELAAYIDSVKGVHLDGLQAYEGHLVMIEAYEERKKRVEKDMMPLLETRKMLEKIGYHIFISSGGTGTYDITGNIEGIDEIQCGSYALMDTSYKKIRPEFRNARYVLATVLTVRKDIVVADVGLKGLGNEYGTPVIIGHPDAQVLYVAEEHIVMKGVKAAIGEKIKILPPHGCTTNNLYPRMWISRDGIITDIWDIEGRGCLE